MDKYPFGNFRDNPPLPFYVWNQPSFFSPETHGHTIPYAMPSGFQLNHMDNPYPPYTTLPVLFPAEPFISNFSFPPPPPGTQMPGHIDLQARTFHPPLAPRPHRYFVLQTPCYQSDVSSQHPLTGPDVLDKQSRRNEIPKQCVVQEETPIFKHDQFSTEFNNAEYGNNTSVSEDHGNVYKFQQQHHEEEQTTPQHIKDMSEQLQTQLKLTGQRSTVKYRSSVNQEMNGANAEISVKEGYRTMNQDENHKIQEKQTDILSKQTAIAGGKTNQQCFDTPQSEMNSQPGVILAQTVCQEQETCTVQKESPAFQQELILNTVQDGRRAQSHQHNIKPENIKQTTDKFHQDKQEDNERMQNNIKRNKSERRNFVHHRHHPRPEHEETPNWHEYNRWKPQHNNKKTQYSDWQTGSHQFQQYYRNSTFRGRFSQNTYQPIGTPQMFIDARVHRNDNHRNKNSETRSNKEGKQNNPQEGGSSDNQKAANSKVAGSRYYTNRYYTSTS